MKKGKFSILLVSVCFLFFSLFSLSPVCSKPALAEKPPVKIGVIRPFTGAVALEGGYIWKGIELSLDDVGWEVAGRKIKVIQEDEGETPEVAVAKAKKLVEEDKVDVIIGPLLAHSLRAVGAYLERLRIPQLTFGAPDDTSSKFIFYYSLNTGRGDTYPGGLFCYDELGARTAAVLVMDYLYGYQLRDGFVSGFTSKGGKIIYSESIPFGTTDMAPYLAAMGKPDVIAVFLLSPCDLAFVKQYREFGLKAPVFFTLALGQEAEKLEQFGDTAVGMYGALHYVPSLDTPANKAFIKKVQAKFGRPPAIHMSHGYWAGTFYLTALKNTGGDTSYDKISDALENITIETPVGPVKGSPKRIITQNIYIVKDEKIDGKYTWKAIKEYPQVPSR